MAFTPAFLIMIIVLVLLIGGIAAIAIYLATYNRRINRQLSEGNLTVKKRMSPAAAAVLIAAVILVLVITVTIVTAINSAVVYMTNRDSGHTIDFDCQTFTNEYSLRESEYYYFAEAYEKGKAPNTSYSVETKTKGKFEYTLFRNEHNYYSTMSPAFALFVKYIGEADYKGFASYAEFSSDSGGSVWADHGENEKYYCVLGNADHSDFHFILSMFRESDSCKEIFEGASNDSDWEKMVLKNADEVFELTVEDINPKQI